MAVNHLALKTSIAAKRSMLCVGLDSDPGKIPAQLRTEANPVLAFNRAIMEATAPYAVAYKINVAFYEAQGHKGWQTLEDTVAAAPKGIYLIADAKRGDIGNTASMYAEAFFKALPFDALTVHPYMGLDTLEPYLAHADKDLYVLACTSNPGFADFENLELANGRRLYEEVVVRCQAHPGAARMHFVAGATNMPQLASIRALAPLQTLLVPGVGAQGGSLHDVCAAGLTQQGSLLINASRSILFASSGQDFAESAMLEAKKMQAEMGHILAEANL